MNKDKNKDKSVPVSRQSILDGISGLRVSLPTVAPQDGEIWSGNGNGVEFEATKKGEVGGAQYLRLVVWGKDPGTILKEFENALGRPRTGVPRISGLNNVTIVFWNIEEVEKRLCESVTS